MTPGTPQKAQSTKAKATPVGKNAAGKRPLPSAVESHFLEQSGRKPRYEPTERATVIEVANFPSLGRLTALRFLEWVQDNPNGVVSLPTGKTPEYFLKWTKHYLSGWAKKEVKDELAAVGIDTSRKPELKGLHFVQIGDDLALELYDMDIDQGSQKLLDVINERC